MPHQAAASPASAASPTSETSQAKGHLIVTEEDIEERLAKLAMRQMVAETLFASAVGYIASAATEPLQRELFDELRKSVVAKVQAADRLLAERQQLELDEAAAQLIDQMQRFAQTIAEKRKNV